MSTCFPFLLAPVNVLSVAIDTQPPILSGIGTCHPSRDRSGAFSRLAIVTANELALSFPPRNLPKKFRPDPSTFYLVIVVTDRQTNKQTDRQTYAGDSIILAFAGIITLFYAFILQIYYTRMLALPIHRHPSLADVLSATAQASSVWNNLLLSIRSLKQFQLIQLSPKTQLFARHTNRISVANFLSAPAPFTKL